jgi:hypothetical protein
MTTKAWKGERPSPSNILSGAMMISIIAAMAGSEKLKTLDRLKLIKSARISLPPPSEITFIKSETRSCFHRLPQQIKIGSLFVIFTPSMFRVTSRSLYVLRMYIMTVTLSFSSFHSFKCFNLSDSSIASHSPLMWNHTELNTC